MAAAEHTWPTAVELESLFRALGESSRGVEELRDRLSWLLDECVELTFEQLGVCARTGSFLRMELDAIIEQVEKIEEYVGTAALHVDAA